ncbi:MAG: hypothetical protein HY767_02940, partial [Candidatus Omnitrophica bacterium]|nr:hypothetical protein [Candidatus Omnitrophota bacterium]
SIQGAGDPVYQWTSSRDTNVSYSMSLNQSVPVGVTNAPTGTEVTFTKNTRVSRREVTEQMALIPNETVRASELARLSADANFVYFTRQDSGRDDPSFQWSALGDSNNSFSLSLNSKVPVGIPVNGVYPGTKTEATFSASTRVSRSVVAGYIHSDANGDWIANPEDRAAALAAYNAAIAMGSPFYSVQSGTGDPVLQWSVGSDPNTSYTLSVKDDMAAGWHSSLFSYSKRVSREYVAEQYKSLSATDSRKVALEAAL